MLMAMWQGMTLPKRVSLVGAVLCVLAVVAALAWWALRSDEEVLFAALSPADAASMTAELERMKQPYRIGPDGTSILVERRVVPPLRLKLMGRDLPLHGAVGFELFNNADFGITEFAQKVNYQRALQGEITRTILSIEEVESARVHLVLPEERLFRNEQGHPKASITLGLRRGRGLRRDQIGGIQRLVAAAVPGIAVTDVTIVNQQGVALTSSAAPDGSGTNGVLELKQEVERHLQRKASEVLDRALGAGVATASVDVLLDARQVRVTKEEVLGGPGTTEEAAGATGVAIRERESFRDGAATAEGTAAAGVSSREVEYQVGRRVEQVVSQPGSILRLQAVALLPGPANAAREEQVRSLLAAAVGAMPARGDAVVVQSLSPIQGDPGIAGTSLPSVVRGAVPADPAVPAGVDADEAGRALKVASLAAVSGTGLWGLWWLIGRRRRGASRLSDAQRDEARAKLQRWLSGDTVEREA